MIQNEFLIKNHAIIGTKVIIWLERLADPVIEFWAKIFTFPPFESIFCEIKNGYP